MKFACVTDDKVRILSRKYGPFQGVGGVVTRDYPTDFRVKVGEVEIIITNPAEDIEVRPVDLADVIHLTTCLAMEVLPKRSELKIKNGRMEVQIPPRDFLRSFDTFEREPLSSGTFLKAERNDITFSAFADNTLMADYDLDKTTAQETSEGTPPDDQTQGT